MHDISLDFLKRFSSIHLVVETSLQLIYRFILIALECFILSIGDY